MNPLFEMLTNMQANMGQSSNTDSISQQMAKQFGLQQDQAQKAMEALMPAFTQGLKRNAAASPQGMASFMEALASGGHADYINNPMKAFTPAGMQEGNAILGHLFGNKEVSRAVAAQAEAASGVSQSILKQMLPALAPMVMGGMFNQLTEPQHQAQNAFGGANGGILGQILEQVMKGGLQQGSPQGQPRGRSRAKNPLETMLEQMMGGGGRTTGGSGGNPGGALGDIFNDMIKNGPMGKMGEQMGGNPAGNDPSPYDDAPAPDLNDVFGRETQSTAPEASKPQGYPKGTGLEDLFGDLFKPTKQGAPQYDKSIEAIFDTFLKPKR